MHALMWKIFRKALRWLWQWFSPWSLLTLHPKMQMPTTYASACSAAMYRIWGKGCAWVHNVRRATSAFQRMRWVVGCNHGAKKIRLPRPAPSRWRKVVKNDLPEMIGVDHLTSDPRAVNMQHGQPVSERACTQELARKGWTSRCGGRENIGFSNQSRVGWEPSKMLILLQSLRLQSLRLVEKPQSLQMKRYCGFKKPKRLEIKGWRSKSDGDMLLRPILACLPQPSLQWQRRRLWFSCTMLPQLRESNWHMMLWPKPWPKSQHWHQHCQRQRLQWKQCHHCHLGVSHLCRPCFRMCSQSTWQTNSLECWHMHWDCQCHHRPKQWIWWFMEILGQRCSLLLLRQCLCQRHLSQRHLLWMRSLVIPLKKKKVKRQPEMICLIEIEWLKAPVFQHEMGSDCSCKKRV